jgi:hypothetical protein
MNSRRTDSFRQSGLACSPPTWCRAFAAFALLTLVAPGFHGRAFASSEFWNDKKPEDWSEKEIQHLLTRSPWAKEVVATFDGGRGPMRGDDGAAASRSGRGRDSYSGMIDAAPSGGGGGGRGRGDGGGLGEGGGHEPQIKAVVRWETAAPVVAARRKQLPSSVQDQYVVSVSGLPMMGGNDRIQGMEERLKVSTMLERKGRDPIYPAKVTGGRSEGIPTWIFFFPHGSQPIDPDDKEVTFKTKIGPVEVKTKFALKDMKYQGHLAL